MTERSTILTAQTTFPANVADDANGPAKSDCDSRHPPDLERLAILIAEGHATFPLDVPQSRATQLAGLVRERRRTQLIAFIARQIARTIYHNDHQVQGGQ